MTIDNTWKKVINGLPEINSGISFSVDDALTGLGYASDAIFGTNFIGNSTNAQIARENMVLMDKMNKENIAFQKEENAITRQREDNAIQRAAIDMESAGLSKTLAAGNPASAQSLTAPSGQAIQNEHKYNAAVGSMDLAKRIQDLYFEKKADERADDLNKANVDKLEAETKAQTISNEYLKDSLMSDIAYKTASTEMTKATVKKIQAETRIAEITSENTQRQIDVEIDKALAEIKNKNVSTEKIYEEVKKILLEKKEISASIKKILDEDSLLLYDVIKAKHDINYAQKHGLPVGAIPGNVLGVSGSAVEALWNLARKDSGFVPFTSPTSGNTFWFNPENEQEIWDQINNSGYPF